MHYAARLHAAIAAGHLFVLGPAAGVDSQALSFLHAYTQPEGITVYVTEYENRVYRVKRLAWHEKAGGKIRVAGRTTGERDAVATKESDYDILKYFTEEEARACYGEAWFPKITATEINERRRRMMAKVERNSEKKGGRRVFRRLLEKAKGGRAVG